MRQTTLTTVLLLIVFALNAQNTIKGTVSAISGPLPFANVIVSGTDIGTVADAKGGFSIEIKKGDTLIISYVGYTPKRILTTNTKHLDILLENDLLDEVVLIGYGTRHYRGRGCDIHSLYKTPNSSLSAQKTGRNLDSNPNTIYPNPSSSGYFTLDFLETYKNVEISVVAITGQIIFSRSYAQPKNNINLDLSRFSTGIYIVNTVADGRKLASQKIIRS